jgi:oligoendopeptidase F
MPENSSKYPTSWNLQKYFYTSLEDPQLENDVLEAQKLIDIFIANYKGKIPNLKPEEFVKFFESENQINHLLYKAMLYVFYLSSLDTQNQNVIKKEGQLQLKITDLSNKLLFVAQEFKNIGTDNLLKLSQNQNLKDYQNYFQTQADNLKYILDEKTEFALNLKENSGNTAMMKLQEELTGSFEFKLEIDGETKAYTEEEVRSLRSSPNEEIRKKATESIQEVYSQKANQITLGNIYNSVIKDWTSEIKIRNYPSILSQRNLSEQMPDEAINLLLKEVTNRSDIYQKYLGLKLKLAIHAGQQKDGGDKLKSWNLLAPISKNEKTYSFDNALKTFLKTLAKFDTEMHDLAVEMFEGERVDVYPKLGKRGGAYASYEKDFESFVLLNFTGKLNDVATIAHELGHSIHGILSQKQKSQVYGTGLCLAETASVFNEMLFATSFLPTLETAEEKIDFLDMRLQDIFATIFVQIMYASFELEVHQTIADGKDLTYEDFNKMWRGGQQKMYGDSIEFSVPADKSVGWSGIPHIFHTPFYVYSYAFGNLLTFALYQKYKEEGASFVEKYKNILRSGGSKSPYELLLENGLDITKPEFYQDGLKVVEEMVANFEKEVETFVKS